MMSSQLRMRLLVVLALVLLVALTPSGSACGWYETCETEAWLKETIAPFLP